MKESRLTTELLLSSKFGSASMFFQSKLSTEYENKCVFRIEKVFLTIFTADEYVQLYTRTHLEGIAMLDRRDNLSSVVSREQWGVVREMRGARLSLRLSSAHWRQQRNHCAHYAAAVDCYYCVHKQ